MVTKSEQTFQFFSTHRADTVPTTRPPPTKNPLLAFFENLSTQQQKQQFHNQRSAGTTGGLLQQLTQPQEQVVSFVRPIQEQQNQVVESKQSGGDGGVNLMRMLIQLPGNILVGMLRFLRTTGEFMSSVMSGVMKMIGGFSGGGTSSTATAGLFGR